MTNNFKTYRNTSEFGGVIYLSDFDTYPKNVSNAIKGSPIAQRIASDRRFDQSCQTTYENKRRMRVRNAT